MIRQSIGRTALAIFAAAAVGFMATPIEAADKGGKPAAASDFPYMPPAATSWTGFGIGGFAGYNNADLDTGAPITIGSTGYGGGVEVYGDKQWGSFVLGAFARYGWVWGDLHTLGVDNTLDVGVRAGLLPSPSSLAYAHVEWCQARGSIPDTNCVGAGLGLEVRLQGAPIFVDLRATRRWFDGAVGGMDVNADEVTLALKYKFSMGK